MSNEIDDYKKQIEILRQFDQWARLIGKEYYGGTRGKGGEFGRVVNVSSPKIEVYYQEYDGATNYHEYPPECSSAMSKAVMKHSGQIIQTAREILIKDLSVARKAAQKWAEEMLSISMDDEVD